jgi:hypothetical protein
MSQTDDPGANQVSEPVPSRFAFVTAISTFSYAQLPNPQDAVFYTDSLAAIRELVRSAR